MVTGLSLSSSCLYLDWVHQLQECTKVQFIIHAPDIVYLAPQSPTHQMLVEQVMGRGADDETNRRLQHLGKRCC